MPVPSRHIGRSQSWDAAGWYEGTWESDSPFECQRPLGTKNSVTCGERVWYERPTYRPHDTILQGSADKKQVSYPYLEPIFNQSPFRRGSVPDFSYYNKQLEMSAQSSLPLQDCYTDPSLATRSPKDPCSYRDHMTNRSLSNYGMPGGRFAWDQMEVRSPALHEANKLYRNPVTKMVPEEQRIRNRDSSLTRYGVDPTASRSRIEHSTFPYQQVYSDTIEGSIDCVASRQFTPTSLVVDPNSTAAPDGNVILPATSINQMHGPTRESSSIKILHDGCEATMIPSHIQMPASFPGQDIKKKVDLEYLATMRSEGVSESTLSALLQQGFDSPHLLVMMEDNDIKSVAPNLGQARALSRIVHTYRAEIQARKSTIIHPRHSSNSLSHQREWIQDMYGIHPATSFMADSIAVYQAPTVSMQPPSSRVAELTRRPSSAPTQRLLEAATYPVSGLPHQVTPFLPSSGHGASDPCNMHSQQASGYSASSGIPMNTLQASSQASSKTAYSTTYTVPMELMKRNPPLSPVLALHRSPQLQKQGVQVETNLMPAAPSFPVQHSPYQNPARRTGPPVVISTMASPEPSNSKMYYFVAFIRTLIVMFVLLF